MESCLHQICTLKDCWSKLLVTQIETLLTQNESESNAPTVTLAPKGKSRYKTKGNSSSAWGKKSAKHASNDNSRTDVDRPLTNAENSINAAMVTLGCEAWRAKDFEILSSKNLHGTDLYLNDAHFSFSMRILRDQFPDVSGLQNTGLYQSSGFESSLNQVFVQPVHAGHSHWACVSNIQTSSGLRSDHADLYDSLWNLSDNPSEHELSPAIVWQVAQLLRKKDWSETRHLFLTVKPVEQQRNGVDCGLYSIFNMISLLRGQDPTQLSYSSTMRKQLLEMIESKEMDDRYVLGVRDSRNNFKFQKKVIIGNVPKMADIQESCIDILVYCHCQMPESFGDLIQCEMCENHFHACCYLIDLKVAQSLEIFVCYHCREPENYSFCSAPLPIDNQLKKELVSKLKESRDLLLRKHLPASHARPATNKIVITSKVGLEKLEGILSSFDLNCLKNGSGELYNSFSSFNGESDRRMETAFFSLNVAELTHFAVLVICELLGKTCEPIYTGTGFQVCLLCDDVVASFIRDNRKWIRGVGSELAVLGKRIERFVSKKRNMHTSKDFYSSCEKDLSKTIEHVTYVNKHILHDSVTTEKRFQFRQLQLGAENILKTVEENRRKLKEHENRTLQK